MVNGISQFTFDENGNLLSMTDENGTSTDYFYDDASRVTQILHNGPAGIIEDLLYTYDAAGNRINFSRTGPQADLPAEVQAAHNAANQLTQFNTDTLTYDENGNLTSDGTTTYTWDARNRLITMNDPSVSGNFVYDALGRRVSKTINGTTTEYIYDGNDIVAEIQGGAVGATYLRSLNIDESFIRQSSSGTEYYHTDALGSTMALSDDTGTVQTTYSYGSFGSTTIFGSSSNPFQYTGRENDGTGLFYYRARYYSSELKRFISEDPLRLLGSGTNLFNYVNNNPISWIDPTGLTTWPTDYGTVTDPFGSTMGRDTPHTGVDIRNPIYSLTHSSPQRIVHKVPRDARAAHCNQPIPGIPDVGRCPIQGEISVFIIGQGIRIKLHHLICCIVRSLDFVRQISLRSRPGKADSIARGIVGVKQILNNSSRTIVENLG